MLDKVPGDLVATADQQINSELMVPPTRTRGGQHVIRADEIIDQVRRYCHEQQKSTETET